MPMYEMVLLIRQMDKSSLKKALKRSAEYIFEVGGTLRRMQNLGLMDTPYRMVVREQSYSCAHYFIFNYDAGVDQAPILKDNFKRDLDVLRATSFVTANSLQEAYEGKPKHECTLYLDLLPPPERPAVIEIQKSKKEKPKYKFNTGLDYNPFT